MGLFDSSRIWHDNEMGMETVVLRYFEQLLTSHGNEKNSPIFYVIESKVTDSMNAQLLSTFTDS